MPQSSLPQALVPGACQNAVNKTPGLRIVSRFLAMPTRSTGLYFGILVLALLLPLSHVKGETPSEKARPITILFDDSPSVDQIGFLVAKELGIYQKAGLPNIQFQWNEGRENPFELFIGNKIDFAVFWMAEGIVARANDIPVTAIALLAHGTGACLVTRNDLYPNFLDLRSIQNRKISLWGCCSITPKAFLLEKGISGQFISQRSNASMLFSTGGTDVMFSTLYDAVVLFRYLVFRDSVRLFVFSGSGCTYPETTLFCRDSLLKSNPELCRKFTRATFEGWRRAMADPDTAVRVLIRYCKEAGIHQDEYILHEQFHEWKRVMQFRMPIESNGDCEKARFDILRKDLIKTKLVDSSKCAVFDDFFKCILNEETFDSIVKGTTQPRPTKEVSQERKTK